MMKSMKKPLAIALLAALAACTGGPTAQSLPPGPTTVTPAPGSGQVLVGIGDSLTAGYQSSGFLGDINPVTSPLSNYPPYPAGPGSVYPGQESGFWSIMYQEMVSPVAGPFPNNAEVPVMPLIKGPGLGNQLVLNKTALFIGSHPQGACDSFNALAYSSSTWQGTRLNPSGTVLDLGVPGITMHEAIGMRAPLTGPPPGPVAVPTSVSPTGFQCPSYANIPGDPTSGGLQSLVNGESLTFYPVLGGFQNSLGAPNLTELNAAVSLKPQLATVWLGANDLLKYIFSGGLSPVSDTPTQMAADLTQIVNTLKAAGSKVLVADLPNVLTTPQFFSSAKFVGDCTNILTISLPAPLQANAGNYCTGVNASLAANTSVQYTAGAYLTESGFFATISQAGAAIAKNPAAPDFTTISLDPNGAGSGLGAAYLTPAFATQVATVNAAYNQAIDGVANASGNTVALVPITATFNSLVGTNLSTVMPGAPPLTLQFGGGLLSWDGLHPSNAGYAVIAYQFINTANTKLGLTIPNITGATVTAIAGQDPYNPTLVDTAIGGVPGVFPFPLP